MPISKSNWAIQSIRSSFVYLTVATVLMGAEWWLTEWLTISIKKVSSALLFLSGLYLLFYFLFVFIQKKHPDNSAFIFLILMGLKLAFIISYLFLFLNPTDSENKTEILLFLMNYFALLIVDIVVKLRLIK